MVYMLGVKATGYGSGYGKVRRVWVRGKRLKVPGMRWKLGGSNID